jgi:hypothetical protein
MHDGVEDLELALGSAFPRIVPKSGCLGLERLLV